MSRVSPAEVGSAANSYEVLAKLAMGGMAEIFLARGASAAGVERYVVLKRVLRHKSTDTDLVNMFLDEARLAAQLQHPNIAQVYDIGKLGDSYFFTMEYVHGETIRNLLARAHALRQHIPIGTVLSVIAGAAAGLQHAHERKGMDGKPLGIVHRDVSPSNLMVSYEGTVKVVDFGVAKAAHRHTETRSGTVKGKITYMSPEQCRGLDNVDRRSDLFSLGIVMWEMLTVDRLYRRNSDFENMQAIVNEPVAPPSTIRAGIPPEIDRIVMRLLEKEPARRFQTADEVQEAVEAAAVATGSALSASSLGRYMRDIFGQRPEPWIELMSQMQHPEAHTVTGEPLGGELTVTPPPNELDLQLSAVPLLSQNMPAQNAPAVPRPLTIPLRVQLDNVVEIPRPGPTVPMRAATAPPATMLMPPALVPHAGAHIPAASSAPYSLMNSSSNVLSSYAGAAFPQLPPAPAPTRSRVPVVVAAIGVIAIGVGLALAVNRSKRTSPAAKPDTEPAVVALTPVPSVAPPAPPPVAAPPAAEPAATPPAEPPPTASPPKAPPSVMASPTEPPAAKVQKRPPPARADVTTLLKAGRFGDAVAECNSSTKTVALNAAACTLAACKAHETAKAKRWFASVATAKRSAIVKDCGGVLPAEPKPATDPCKRDPLACQH